MASVVNKFEILITVECALRLSFVLVRTCMCTYASSNAETFDLFK